MSIIIFELCIVNPALNGDEGSGQQQQQQRHTNKELGRRKQPHLKLKPRANDEDIEIVDLITQLESPQQQQKQQGMS